MIFLNACMYVNQPDPIPGFIGTWLPCPTFAQATQSYAENSAKIALSKNRVVIYDLETEDFNVGMAVPVDIAKPRLKRMADMADWTRAKGMSVGFYGFPLRAYWDGIQYASNITNGSPRTQFISDSFRFERWNSRNSLIREYLAPHVDAVYPSLYSFYTDDSFQQYFRANLAQAYTWGKPVAPFIWPGFHPSQKLGIEMSIELWKKQVALIKQLCDGAVIWGGFLYKDGKPIQLSWDDKARDYFSTVLEIK